MLYRVETGENRGLALKVLCWLAYSFRPLSIKELQAALRLGSKATEEANLSFERLSFMCEGFLSLRRRKQTVHLLRELFIDTTTAI